MNSKSTALIVLVAALAGAAVAHQLIDREAAVLGLTLLEVTLLAMAAGAVAQRTIPA